MNCNIHKDYSTYKYFRKRQTLQEHWTNDINRQFIDIANKSMKLCSIALIMINIIRFVFPTKFYKQR